MPRISGGLIPAGSYVGSAPSAPKKIWYEQLRTKPDESIAVFTTRYLAPSTIRKVIENGFFTIKVVTKNVSINASIGDDEL